MWSGSGITADTVRGVIANRSAVIVSDMNVPSAAALTKYGRSIRLDARQVHIDTVRSLAQDIATVQPEVVVAIGGGTIIDAAKIATLGARSSSTFTYLMEHALRSGLTVLPPAQPSTDLVAIPTTVGTSTETNSVGILATSHGYRLIVGHSLRPRHAIIDSDNLDSLPDSALRAGALEALLRLAGVSTSTSGNERAHRDAVVIARSILDAANSDLGSSATRLRVARLSAATQRTGALRGRDPYAARHWYVANEVAFALSVSKMSATAAIIGAIWTRICAGDHRWGTKDSLEAFWRAMTERAMLPREPVAGVTALIESWSIERPSRPDDRSMREIAAASELAWGNRRPMLRGVGEKDVREVLEESLWAADEPALRADRSLHEYEEVNT
ncbi:iron-containing alcohol dehydrogenase [Microbacterium foliorum]|uniref:Aldehyde-alcohol dehydrogenase n=2 Tax=Microbacterium foliorum TaxID=104336 RepID=A0A0F0L284_9MICO|nr:iron-containing alcohol dehydrogenase [Microbacterium foliorum]KJL25641.1 Aldehyde-alcohol dehydrogenase [Microbacterium foliorum]